jgi:AcrR family transcriptional regulator
MGRLAEAVGVSRQTVYNEVGNKPALAEAMILDELRRFLALVESAFALHPDDLVAAIRAAVVSVLEHARGNALLHAVVSATHGTDTELLPLLTTHSGELLSVAKDVVLKHVRQYEVTLGADRLEAAVDTVVRVVLSHVMQPSGDPARAADAIGWIADRVLHDPASVGR